MCGIAGWVSYRSDLTAERDTLLAMTRTLAARGPDGEGLWADTHVALGHRRLAVIDPDGGAQPMSAMSNGRTVAVATYNGEIYNYRELRHELELAGHTFDTRSDTEVMLHAYLQWDVDFVSRLNGMYAIAIWDARTEELLLVRDRLGVKPLYYAPLPGGVLFGSEPKAILAHREFSARVTPEGLAGLLTNLRSPGYAPLRGLREVRPGHLVKVSRSGCTERRYWGLDAHDHSDDLGTTVSTVRSLLEDIVDRQVVADVPLCTLLSGGLDSSAITALAARTLDTPVRSYALDFTAPAGFVPDPVRTSADAPIAALMAGHLGAQHSTVELSAEQLAAQEVFDAVLRARDLPAWGDLDNSLYLLLDRVRQGATVALSGEAADELFGGYLWFHTPEAIGADTFPWFARLIDWTPQRGGSVLDPTFMWGVVLPTIRQQYEEALAEVPRLSSDSPAERRMREVSSMFLTRMLPEMLDRKDRISMAVGVEVRVPFCDHRLVDYVFNAPWALKTHDGREKSLLRSAVADLLPDVVAQRVKVPYPATQDPGYERAIRRRFAAIVADRNAPVRPLLDLAAAREALTRPVGQASMQHERLELERIVTMNDWLSRYGPELI
ncbi:asparagine synthase (glutamine-hydrolyzing) [Micromonospora andamanensis]|uniref:asparagine synthase (glutamine-hydrolyzing) n=1 Tax=Micromonospora andamanensis TaxID=1287068 RepID=A0ABQ4I2F0_9ACTN|nr:asparagine synthase (glutamine-hydrolyzing) [Micromonospora andamanensis]GIJ12063.1 asparagine synthetase B [Micromonospora andamanensis]